MRYSIFNTTIDKGEYLILYNSLSGALLKLSKKKIDDAKDILIQKGFLVEDNENEVLSYKYIYYNQIFSKKSLDITIAPTTDCNLCCPYCFEEGNKHKEYMDDITLNAIAKYIISKKERTIELTWFGGEPLLCYDKIVKLNDLLISNNVSFTTSIITNGTLFTDDKIKLLNQLNIQQIQITLDGEQENHDKKRFFRKNQQGTYTLILSNIEKILKNTSITLFLKINVDKENLVSCKELMEFLHEKFQEYLNNGTLKISSNYIRNITNFEGCEKCITEEEYLNFYTKVEHNQLSIPQLCLPCPLRVQSHIVIGPDGSIYKCLEFIGNKAKSIGNINSFSISVSKLAKYALKYEPFEDPECQKCSILPICGGGCPNERELKAFGKRESICPSIKKEFATILENVLKEEERKS
ncbi:radical SAM protein [Bacteroides heparinolyticus]|uniref:radical SAM protein n=1 Tax=Prevotella heparinolytica TaxID=28113 RepID=UPI003F9FD67B